MTSYLYKKFIFPIEKPTVIRASVLLLESHLLFCEQCQAVPSKPLFTSSIPTLIYYLPFPFEAILFLGFQFQSFCGLQYYFAMLL